MGFKFRALYKEEIDARIEDALFMAEHKEQLETAARRLNIRTTTLASFLKENAPEVYEIFLANKPVLNPITPKFNGK